MNQQKFFILIGYGHGERTGQEKKNWNLFKIKKSKCSSL